MRRILGLIGLLLTLVGFTGRSIPLATPKGRACPTAPVAKVRVAVRSVCGCVIGFTERAARPGEKGFVQCRCGERRTAQESSPPPAPTLPLVPLVLNLPILPLCYEAPGYLLRLAEGAAPPAFRPPALA